MKNVLGGVVGEGRKPHKTTSYRKIITTQEWAEYLGVSRLTVHTWMSQYNLVNTDNTYNPRDILSILRFLDFVRETK